MQKVTGTIYATFPDEVKTYKNVEIELSMGTAPGGLIRKGRAVGKVLRSDMKLNRLINIPAQLSIGPEVDAGMIYRIKIHEDLSCDISWNWDASANAGAVGASV